MSGSEASEAVLLARHLDRDGRLLSMPVRRPRRLLVLRHLVQRIPSGVELDEYAVNNLLRPVSDDVAMLRRLLVDEGFLVRPRPAHYVRPASDPAGDAGAPG